MGIIISRARYDCVIHQGADSGRFLGCQDDVGSSKVLLEALGIRGAMGPVSWRLGAERSRDSLPRDRENIVALTQQPRDGQLPRRAAPRRSYISHRIDDRKVLGEVLLREPRVQSTVIICLKVGRVSNLPREHTARQRRVSDNRNTELAARCQEANLAVLNLGREEAILDLDGCDGVDSMSPAQSLGRHFAQAQIADLPLPIAPPVF